MEDLKSLTQTEIGKEIISRMAKIASVSQETMKRAIIEQSCNSDFTTFFLETMSKTILEMKAQVA